MAAPPIDLSLNYVGDEKLQPYPSIFAVRSRCHESQKSGAEHANLFQEVKDFNSFL